MDAPLRPSLPLTWRQAYAELGPGFARPCRATPLPDLYWVSANHRLAQALGLPQDWHTRPGVLEWLGGGWSADAGMTVATVYSGHQFGVWAGQLGDGRALLLGQSAPLPGSSLGAQEWQLKGAGKTPFSRMGDGRAVLRSSIREYLCSEAMHGLGIPTTRALSLIGSPATVYREEAETAAVVTRLAPSFLRFGHFEHFASVDQDDALLRLLDFVVQRGYLGIDTTLSAKERALAMLHACVERTAELISHWQAVGFCHGVMNTDNMSLLGLTLDYGPFQFMDTYDPGHICNHSDHQGRYAFSNQPRVAHWNLYCLGQALMPLINDTDATVAVLDQYTSRFEKAWHERLRLKLGLVELRAEDPAMGQDFLTLLASQQVDHTVAWRRLSDAVRGWSGQPRATEAFARVAQLFDDSAAWSAWLNRYLQRLQGQQPADTGERMRQVNPAFVLRNHLAEVSIRRAREGDFSEVETLLSLLSAPYDDHPGFESYAQEAPPWAQSIAISCSS